jgi:hypothetical protein
MTTVAGRDVGGLAERADALRRLHTGPRPPPSCPVGPSLHASSGPRIRNSIRVLLWPGTRTAVARLKQA